MFKYPISLVQILVLMLSSGELLAHKDPKPSVPSLRACRVHIPIQVDGRLDEPFWKQTPQSSGFVDARTHKIADQQTVVRVAYNQTHIYVAVECLDDQIDQIHAAERREDRSFEGDDWVEVHFEPFHAHRTKYAFFSNPLGTPADANEGPSGEFNRGWTADWELAATIQEDRWVFEMSIPLGVMNYERKDHQTWGLNFTRVLRRTDVTSFWSFNPTDYFKPRHFGHLTHLDLADSTFDRNWEISPYVSARVDFDGDTDTLFQTGLDVGVRLTPSIATAWTINPDFGQVEADADTIELRDTERFLPEKRLFFREGNELFNMPHDLYYSRRFTDIDGGAKVSGFWKGFNFTFLDILGDATHDTTDYGNSAVLRVIQDVGEKSSVGYYIADSELEMGHSRVASSDGYFFLTEDWRIQYQLSVADDQREDEAGNEVLDSMDYLGSGKLIYNRYPWDFNVGYRAITEKFNPLLSFIPRRNIFGPSFMGMYEHGADDQWYKEVRLGYFYHFYQNEEHQTTLRDHMVFSRVEFPNDVRLGFSYEHDFHDPYDNNRAESDLVIFSSDYWRSIDFEYAVGEFEETRYNEFGLEKGIKFIERWPISYEFTIRMEDLPSGERNTAWLNRIVFDFFFTDKMWIKSSLQHRDEGIHNISVIYGWEFIHNAHWYLVFNDVDDGEEAGKSIFTKIVYTF